jgi:hypothetical protein
MVVVAQHTIPAGRPPAFVRDVLFRCYRSRMVDDSHSRRRSRPCHDWPTDSYITRLLSFPRSSIQSVEYCFRCQCITFSHSIPFVKAEYYRLRPLATRKAKSLALCFDEHNPPRVSQLNLQKLGPDVPVAALVSIQIDFRVNRESRLPIHVGCDLFKFGSELYFR